MGEVHRPPIASRGPPRLAWLTVVGLLLAACAGSTSVETVVDAQHVHGIVGSTRW